MKKYIPIVFIFTFIFVLTACTTPTKETESHKTKETEVAIHATEPEPTAIYEPEISVSDIAELPDDIKGMIIPIDSLLLYHAETGKEYDITNSHMLWRTLQYAVGNFGENYNRAEIKDYNLTVEPMTIGEFTTSIVDGDYQDHPIPEELKNDVWYETNDDLYYFALGDRGASQTEIMSYQYLEENTLKIIARLYGLDDNSTICSGSFYLKRNNYASGVIEPLFYYTVTNVEFTE